MEHDTISRPPQAGLTFSDEPGVQRIVTVCLEVRARSRCLPDQRIISVDSPRIKGGALFLTNGHQSIHAWPLAESKGWPERTATDGGQVRINPLRNNNGSGRRVGPGLAGRPGRRDDLRRLRLTASGSDAQVSRWVMRITSSMVVWPLSALIIPSSNSVCIPCLRANLRTFCVDSPLNVISRTCAVMVISS